MDENAVRMLIDLSCLSDCQCDDALGSMFKGLTEAPVKASTNDTAQQSGLPACLPSAAHCAHQINARNPAARQQGNHVFTRL